MVVSEAEIQRMARDLIAQWGWRAAHVAVEGAEQEHRCQRLEQPRYVGARRPRDPRKPRLGAATSV